ncbi:MAG TPA: Uma2 family endonuclease [Tepidisphaeraceae bacterium]|nr:Uma2 family endonuclease [Tepidisphaeraceae bacterium]
MPKAVKRYTPEEYYRLERDATYKSDYYDGEIFAMAGGTSRHALIGSNINREVGNGLKGTPCAAYSADQRLKIKTTGLRVYPDVSVYCGPLEYDAQDANAETATNPTVLIEVLSPSTESYDRGFKAENYRQIKSLRAYVLVSQDKPHVEVYERQADDSWVLREENRLDAAVKVPGISVTLPLAEVYDRIEFSASDARPKPPGGSSVEE